MLTCLHVVHGYFRVTMSELNSCNRGCGLHLKYLLFGLLHKCSLTPAMNIHPLSPESGVGRPDACRAPSKTPMIKARKCYFLRSVKNSY